MKLHRAWYSTDINADDPEYDGAFSEKIPDPAIHGRTIVGVDWSNRGYIEVTYLIPEL